MANERCPSTVKAIYSFKGKNNDELNFTKGDIITITQVVEGGWWEGTLDDVTGWFPSNYVKEYKPDANSRKGSLTSLKLSEYLGNRQENLRANRSLVITDMVDTEKTHVTDLQNLLQSYLHPLQQSDLFTASDYNCLVGNLEEVVDCHQKLLTMLEESSELPAKQQRLGGLFIQLAPQLKSLHLVYCANHPKAVTILEKFRDKLGSHMESHGAPAPGIMVLTTGLSKPFRRLEKYASLLQELERHMEESHADRGDTQRAIHVYRDIAASCLAIRRQREMELEVMTGTIHGWEGEAINTLGEIIAMASVVVFTEAKERKDRYLVLFPQTLIMLSVNQRMSAFLYEGKLPLSGITVSKVEDTETYQNAFEITGSMIERIVVICTMKEEQEKWLDLLQRQLQVNCMSGKAAVRTSSLHSSSPVISISESMHQNSPVKEPFVPLNKVWTMSCLRPLSPLRPCLALGLKDDHTLRRKKDEKSPNGDAQILSVIESYCTSAKTRYTVNSELLDAPQILIAEEEKIIEEASESGIEEKTLVDTVYALKDSVKELKQETMVLAKNLEDEREARKQLKDIICKHLLVGRDDINWEE